MSGEIRKEFGVRKQKSAFGAERSGADVRHFVGVPRNAQGLGQTHVSVASSDGDALRNPTPDSTPFGCHAGDPRDRRGIIAECDRLFVAQVLHNKLQGHLLQEHARPFCVRDGYAVVDAEASNNVRRPFHSPDEGLELRVER